MGTRKRPRVCCLAIDLWRIIKIYSEKHVFDGTPLYSSAYSVVNVLFSLFWCGGSGKEKGEKGSQKVCSNNSIKNNCPKKYILLTFYQPKHRSIRSNLSNTNTTQSYCVMWSSLSSSQKVRIFRFFRWRRASGGHWIFNCDPIQISIQIGGARNFPPCSKYAPRFYSRSLLCFVFVVFL